MEQVMMLPRPVPAPEERFAAVHAACHNTVFRYLARRIIPAHLAEDLTGEVFVIVWEKVLGGAQPETAYVVAIARNLLRGAYRATAKASKLRSAFAHERMRPRVENPQVARALETMKEPARELLLLTYWDSFTTEEIAVILDSSPGAVRVRLHRARKAFATALASDSALQFSTGEAARP
ncbi:sigma-70 family RNA polymerase sigma factor [Paeniglutamicibacter kerguelensis]|uniref:RNA polymerase sigma-70 factor (ECF subfamily) n=2 Tax=Paeniglutamicibacter kerguelensis TaxID=254788 RepID=A0ABS4XL98_9MICC|nr:RNA polymerase sigma-70 factor (ECF subfamily) [Paeniglutamicibacter kerguelensis]